MNYKKLSTLINRTNCLIWLKDRNGNTIIIERAPTLVERLGSKILNSKVLYYEQPSCYEVRVVIDLEMK